jgi:S-adenosylmethionine:tRNA-ribosyltransferase-isomerase (queuine synthetase)
MSENVKFTPEELQALKDINAKLHSLTLRYGEATYEKIVLEKEIDYLYNELVKVESDSIELKTALHEKYGNGRIDLTTGQFTSEE